MKKDDLAFLFKKYLIFRISNGKGELIDATNNKKKAEKMIKSFEDANSLYFIAGQSRRKRSVVGTRYWACGSMRGKNKCQ